MMSPANARLRRLSNQIAPTLPEPLACEAGAGMFQKKTGPLEGVKVVDLTAFVNGPGATMQLSDNGADVLKVEPPEGEGTRVADSPNKLSYGMVAYNRGKRSMVLDLKHPKAKEVMERLVKWADVVTENFRPNIMDKLGFGYEVLKKWNPSIILASNSGFGDMGEWAERASYDGIAQAFTGVASAQAGGPSRRPQLVEFALSDEVGSMNFCQAIAFALFARERNIARGGKGEGQHLVTSQTGATLHFQRSNVTIAAKTGKERDDGLPALAPLRHIQNLYEAGDGKWVTVNHIKPDQFKRFCEGVIQRPDLLAHENTQGYPAMRGKTAEGGDKRDWLNVEIQKTIGTMPRDEILERAKVHSVPMAPASSYKEVVDPNHTVGKHLFANGYLKKVTNKIQGEMTVVGQPTRFNGTPNNADLGDYPELGEHTADALREIAGYSEQEVNELMAAGGAAPPIKHPNWNKK